MLPHCCEEEEKSSSSNPSKKAGYKEPLATQWHNECKTKGDSNLFSQAVKCFEVVDEAVEEAGNFGVVDVDEVRGAAILGTEGVTPWREQTAEVHVSAKVLGIARFPASVAATSREDDLIRRGVGNGVHEATAWGMTAGKRGGHEGLAAFRRAFLFVRTDRGTGASGIEFGGRSACKLRGGE